MKIKHDRLINTFSLVERKVRSKNRSSKLVCHLCRMPSILWRFSLERQEPCNDRSYALESAVSVALSVTALSGESPHFLGIPKKPALRFLEKAQILKKRRTCVYGTGMY